MPAALPRQLVLFLIVGAVQVVLDWAVFVSLTAAGVPLVAGNLAGRLGGASVGYWLNGRHTFAGDGRIRGLERERVVRDARSSHRVQVAADDE